MAKEPAAEIIVGRGHTSATSYAVRLSLSRLFLPIVLTCIDYCPRWSWWLHLRICCQYPDGNFGAADLLGEVPVHTR